MGRWKVLYEVRFYIGVLEVFDGVDVGVVWGVVVYEVGVGDEFGEVVEVDVVIGVLCEVVGGWC